MAATIVTMDDVQNRIAVIDAQRPRIGRSQLDGIWRDLMLDVLYTIAQGSLKISSSAQAYDQLRGLAARIHEEF